MPLGGPNAWWRKLTWTGALFMEAITPLPSPRARRICTCGMLSKWTRLPVAVVAVRTLPLIFKLERLLQHINGMWLFVWGSGIRVAYQARTTRRGGGRCRGCPTG
jgi:hypothetical protein